jgi:two-component system, OmpR family, alkaline phosphatase synthesis response regulator PhoP
MKRRPNVDRHSTGHHHVLIVDDEIDILELLRHNLLQAGFIVTTAQSGEEALNMISRQRPHLLVLDLMLPGIDGLEVARRLKTNPRTARLPILILSAKNEEEDILNGLESGAVDYVTKPFSPQVLIARIRTALRRSVQPARPKSDSLIRIGDIEIDLRQHRAAIKGRALPLTFTEFHVLAFLARRPGWAFTRAEIMSAVRGDTHAATDRSVDVQIVGLRKKIGPYASLIETVRGVGYRLKSNPRSSRRDPPSTYQQKAHTR